jgi:hypothetical protein
MGKFIDLTGQVFGRWTVIEGEGRDKHGHALWLCRCSCLKKTEKIVVGSSLIRCLTKSCGCLRKERVSEAQKGKHHSEETRN